MTSQCQLQVMFDKQADLVRFLMSWTFHHKPFSQFSKCNLTAELIHIGVIFAVIRDKELNHGA